MISWMQKHKKYLVITIWISTIAFVGAGFVGWGAYRFGSGADAVAQVGDIKITYKDLNRKYSTIYEYYNRLFGGRLDQAKAKELGLEKEALRQLIADALLQNYAHDLGLIVTDEEVAQKIASMKVFSDTNGVFDKNIYLKVLANNRLKPKDFEEEIKKELLIQKLKDALSIELFDLEFNTVATTLYIADKIEYKPLSDANLSVEASKEELEKYYRAHKNDFLSPYHFKLGVITIDPTTIEVNEKDMEKFYQSHRLAYKDETGKILPFDKAKEQVKKDLQKKLAKKEALKYYIHLKKGKIKPQKTIEIDEKSSNFSREIVKKLIKSKPGTTLKPLYYNNNYTVIKLIEKKNPKPLSFQEAKNMVEQRYLQEKKRKALLELAKKELKSFKGITTGYICRDDVQAIKKLDTTEAALFLNQLFTKTDKNGIINLSEHKVVLYKILDQKLGKKDKIDKNRALITDNTLKLKSNLLSNDLLKKLQSVYEIKIYKGL